MKSARAALGLRAHSGWAALIALAGPPAAPQVALRRRIVMAEGEAAKQPYHAAEGLPLAKAAALLERFAKAALERATEALAAALDDLRRKGHAPVAAVILTAAGRPLPELKSVLASHALIHTADGEHFRDALAAAIERQGLKVSRVRERDVAAQAEAALGRPAADLHAAVAAWGKPLGAPWTQDQKLSTLGAWIALAGRK
jgi:hypothetical protein